MPLPRRIRRTSHHAKPSTNGVLANPQTVFTSTYTAIDMEGTTEEQFVELAGSFSGPPASPESGATPVVTALSIEDIVDAFQTLILSSGRANWLTVDLAPGTYAAVCYLPDKETGSSHVMLGMVEVFTVSA